MYKLHKVAVAIILPITLIIAGCGSSDPEPVEDVQLETVPQSTELTFGDVYTYEDGVVVSIDVPSPYTPTAQAVGAVEGQEVLQFIFTIMNDSDEELQIAGFPEVHSAGEKASPVADLENAVGDVPIDPVLPGESVEWVMAYSVSDSQDVTIIFSPSAWYDEITFSV